MGMVATAEEMDMATGVDMVVATARVVTARVGMVRMVAAMAIVATPKAITLVKRGTHTTHEREIDDRFLLYERTVHPIYMQQDSKRKKSDVTWREEEKEREGRKEKEKEVDDLDDDVVIVVVVVFLMRSCGSR